MKKSNFFFVLLVLVIGLAGCEKKPSLGEVPEGYKPPQNYEEATSK